MNIKVKCNRALFIRSMVLAGMILLLPAIVSAQEMRVITLQHGTTTTVFYGDKFADAHTAAVDGDIITLSAGTFKVENITKAVKIQGAGYMDIPASNRYITRLDGSTTNGIVIQLSAGSAGLLIEGIYSTYTFNIEGSIKNCVIRKCRLTGSVLFNGTQDNCGVDQCRVGTLNFKSPENCYVKNSAIFIKLLTGASVSRTFVENCTIYQFTCSSVLLRNCIATTYCPIYIPYSWQNYTVFVDNNCMAYNNVLMYYKPGYQSIPATNYLNLANDYSNNSIVSATTLYSSSTVPGDNPFQNESFHLTQLIVTAQSTYTGTDGKQVGIYGGSVPFTDMPTNPQVTAKSIGTSSGTDGKLKVELTVKAQ